MGSWKEKVLLVDRANKTITNRNFQEGKIWSSDGTKKKAGTSKRNTGKSIMRWE